MDKTILIIDDDKKLCRLLTDYLGQFNYKVHMRHDAAEGIALLNKEAVDLIILDIMLPHLDGFEACRKIRTKQAIPIIMLSARGEVTDRIVGLEIGADDYIAKPFEPRELVARIQAVLRRKQGNSSEETVIRFDDLVIDPKKRSVTIAGEDCNLTTLEFEVLLYLASRPGQVFSREQIQERIKGYELNAFDRSVDVLISRLRQKLKDDPKKTKYIRTVWGTGYAFTGK